ncbi:MAG TPA: SRPBCC family protein [Actinomycetes bacterium]
MSEASDGNAPDVLVTEQVSTDPGTLYDLVSDVTRMGSWSPETTSCRWLGGATAAAVGARFRGTNKHGPMRWSTTCTVTAADPGRRFGFDVDFLGVPIAQWGYRFEPVVGGCTVTETWTDKRAAWMRVASMPVMGIADRAAHNRRGMQATLAALRQAAEAR